MRRLIPVYALLAGAGDALTGLLLVTAPSFTLALMGIAGRPAEPIYLRWIGVFVGAVGAFYLYPFLFRDAGDRSARLRVVLEVTALARFAVAVFVAAGVARAALEPAWLTVAGTDLTLAAAQLWMLSRWRPGTARTKGPRPVARVASALAGDLPGIVAVAATYVFFLLYAQFGFVALLEERLAASASVEGAMVGMGLAGFVVSLGVALGLHRAGPRRWLAAGFLGCAASALLSLLATAPWHFLVVAVAIGASTALLTVALATHLRTLIRGRRFGLAVGLGTGVAYLACNLPFLFEGPPERQAVASAVACLVGVAAVLGRRPAAPSATTPTAAMQPAEEPPARPALDRRDDRGWGLASLVLSFLALVWLDSAAFAIIQETPGLKAHTWGGDGRQLLQGVVHLAAAVACGWWIDRGRFRSLLLATYGLFAAAFLLLDPPGAVVAVTGPLYAVGISFYSVALVAYPSYGPEEPGRVPRRWRAALVYGVGGWLGSALGVGMAQNLHHVPRAFLAAAGALIVAGWALARSGVVRRLARAHAVTLLFGVAGVVVYGLGVSGPAPAVAAASETVAPEVLGRRVYVREGCIHCHSQYLRAGTRDVELWGPPQPPDPEATPPLYGNRRQGPDLSTVGLRRSAEWHRLHLIDPRSVAPSSRMPSYRHLFADGDPRGEALVAYLSSLGRGSEEEWNRLLREGAGG